MPSTRTRQSTDQMSRPTTSGYLNLSHPERESYVYRIVSLERLYELFEARKNVLVAPHKWDDPFENFILKSQRLRRQGWFGQCWTRQRASDAMWRIYSSDTQSVRVRSTPKRLMEGLHVGAPDVTAYIGRVRYLPRRPLMMFAARCLKPGHLSVPSHAARTLLVKRPAFRHEAEVRLLVRSDGEHGDGLFRYNVDPHWLFDQLMLDPRLSLDEVERTKNQIREKTGWRGKILRSLLYAPPDLLTLSNAAV